MINLIKLFITFVPRHFSIVSKSHPMNLHVGFLIHSNSFTSNCTHSTHFVFFPILVLSHLSNCHIIQHRTQFLFFFILHPCMFLCLLCVKNDSFLGLPSITMSSPCSNSIFFFFFFFIFFFWVEEELYHVLRPSLMHLLCLLHSFTVTQRLRAHPIFVLNFDKTVTLISDFIVLTRSSICRNLHTPIHPIFVVLLASAFTRAYHLAPNRSPNLVEFPSHTLVYN